MCFTARNKQKSKKHSKNKNKTAMGANAMIKKVCMQIQYLKIFSSLSL